MWIYSIVFVLPILAFLGIVFWIVKIYKFYKQKRFRLVRVNFLVLTLLTLFVGWELRIIPLSADLDFRIQTKGLTGKQFWCWNDYRHEEFGIRGEGFTFEIYELNDATAHYFANPDKDFFERFPTNDFETTKWKETPILDTNLVNFATPIYGNWSRNLEEEIREKQKIVRQIANEKGSYFAVKQVHGTDLYLISPKRKLMVYINHNI